MQGIEPHQVVISFKYPQLVPLAVLITLLLIVVYKRIAKRVNLLCNYLIPVSCNPPKVQFILRTLGLVLLVIAASTPVVVVTKYVPVRNASAKLLSRVSIAHIILVDVSPSMGYRDQGVTRLKEAVMWLKNYLKSIPSNSVVYVYSFSKNVSLVCRGVTSCINVLDNLKVDGNYTAIGTALSYAYTLIRLLKQPSIIVLVTDGAWNYGPNPLEVLKTMGESVLRSLLVVRVGLDPRGDKFFNTLRSMGVKVVTVNSMTLSYALKHIKPLIYQAERGALVAQKVKVPIQVEYSISTLLAVTSLVAILASLL